MFDVEPIVPLVVGLYLLGVGGVGLALSLLLKGAELSPWLLGIGLAVSVVGLGLMFWG